jgi:hypothetical protein
VLSERLYDLAADPHEASPLDATGLGRHGGGFCSAVARVRARLAASDAFEPPCGVSLR